jgi:hypothetical protein
MTEAELIQISRDFKKMVEAIPKTRVREHIPTINQISGLLGRQKCEMYQAARALDAWRELISAKNRYPAGVNRRPGNEKPPLG